MNKELALAILETPWDIAILLTKIPGPGFIVGRKSYGGEPAWHYLEQYPGGYIVSDRWLPASLIPEHYGYPGMHGSAYYVGGTAERDTKSSPALNRHGICSYCGQPENSSACQKSHP